MSTQSLRPISREHSRCRHVTLDGRRCRLTVLDSRSGLCFRHSSLSQSHTNSPDPETAATELLTGIGNFSSANAINAFLGNLVTQLARKRIARRDAIALAYICQLLLNSLSAVQREVEQERHAAARREFLESLAPSRAVRQKPPAAPDHSASAS